MKRLFDFLRPLLLDAFILAVILVDVFLLGIIVGGGL